MIRCKLLFLSLFIAVVSCGSDDVVDEKEPAETIIEELKEDDSKDESKEEESKEEEPKEEDLKEEPKVVNVNTANPLKPTFTSFDDTTPEGKMWERIENMSDEFDEWNSSKWVKTNWNYGDTPVNMVNKNSGVANGNLWIKATWDKTSETQWFETSRVRSRATAIFPMYTECRIKTAHISAFNTFWLNKGDSKNRDEIDIIENNSNPSKTGKASSNLDLDNYPWKMNSQYFIVKDGVTERHHGNSSNKNLSEGNTLKGVKWNEAYHVVGAWWKDANHVQFYLDGEPSGKVTTKQPFTLGQHLIWDLWTQDAPWVGGLPKKEELLDDSINTMKVDWVRTWKLKDKQ